MNPFLHPAVATPLGPEQSVFRPTPLSSSASLSSPAGRAGPPSVGKAGLARPHAAHAGLAGIQPPGQLENCKGSSQASMLPGSQVPGQPRGGSDGHPTQRHQPHGCARNQPRPMHRRWCRAAGSLAVAAVLGVGAATPAQTQPASTVNANIASITELQSIKGIGPKTAQTIVFERQRSGPFESFQDFAERIRGIGPKRARALRAAGLTVSSPRAPGQGEPAPPLAAPQGHQSGSVGVVVR